MPLFDFVPFAEWIGDGTRSWELKPAIPTLSNIRTSTSTEPLPNVTVTSSDLTLNLTQSLDDIAGLYDDHVVKTMHILQSFAKPMPVKIERMDKATAVHWNDGTVTVVRRCEDEPDSLYTAFCAALAKKIYGSTSKVHDVCDMHTVEYMNEQKEKEKKAAREEQLRQEKLRHDRKIRKLAKRLRNEEEAKRLLNEQK